MPELKIPSWKIWELIFTARGNQTFVKRPSADTEFLYYKNTSCIPLLHKSFIPQFKNLFYISVSVGGEVWAGVNGKPLSPWDNKKKDNSPLIKRTMFPQYHMINAEAFIDDENGQAYLYWESGLNWINGACFGVKLAPDMFTFIGEPKNITPPNYYEAPVMFIKEMEFIISCIPMEKLLMRVIKSEYIW